MSVVVGWTEAGLLDEVIVAPRRAYARLPDLIEIERPGWLQIVTPSITNGSYNEIIHAAITEPDVDAVIDRANDEYQRRGLRFRWNLSPGHAPDDLGERLAARGFTPSWGRAMARSTVAAPPPADVEIVRVDADSIAQFSSVMASGWDLDPAAVAAIDRVALLGADAPQGGVGPRLGFLARVDGVPAAVASMMLFRRSAFLQAAVVLPAYRRRGLYRALVAARLQHARTAGRTLATSHARESTSAPILEGLGFATVCRFAMYYSPTVSPS